MRDADEVKVSISSEADVVTAREAGRQMASDIGLNGSLPTVIATAISEVARNIIQYAGRGEIILRRLNNSIKTGIMIIARDKGPGIADVEQAMKDGYTTGRGLGMGLPGTRRLMDEFEIVSKKGKGTTVTMKKWM
ncbi:MAG TPA: anti-sigma regulatory factor [Bacteroidota bacterium]|nr:anti-sigma regulatory factor [Bacteroidota bacterium]